MTRFSVCLLALFASLLVAGCATTELKDSWRNPEVATIQFQKVVVLAITGGAALRQSAEDELVRQAPRSNAVAAYTFISDQDLGNTEKLKQLVKEAGFDGAIVFRILGTEKQQTYVPGHYTGAGPGLWGYYGAAWPLAMDPGYVVTNTFVEVETRVYSVADEKLVWAGRSETMDPRSVRELVDAVAKAVAKELRAQGLIQ
jgi:hypothetical protein